MAKPKMTEDQQDAWDAMQEDVLALGKSNGWAVKSPMGVNKSYAYACLEHAKREERLSVSIPVDPEGNNRFILGSTVLTDKQAVSLLKDPEGWSFPDAHSVPKKKSAAVPPTSAAHTASGVPPTEGASAAHQRSDVPPTSTSDAAHTDELYAAHCDFDSAAHSDDAVPPTADRKTCAFCGKKFKTEDAREDHQDNCSDEGDDVEIDVDAEYKGHVAAAMPNSPKGWGTYKERDLREAVEAYAEGELWSSFASKLTDEEILNRVNKREITWVNRLSGAKETAVVVPGDPSRSAYRPHITGTADFDELDDRRVLHFLESGGGFRSVAIGMLRKIK